MLPTKELPTLFFLYLNVVCTIISDIFIYNILFNDNCANIPTLNSLFKLTSYSLGDTQNYVAWRCIVNVLAFSERGNIAL